jgi:hypothetical protein
MTKWPQEEFEFELCFVLVNSLAHNVATKFISDKNLRQIDIIEN